MTARGKRLTWILAAAAAAVLVAVAALEWRLPFELWHIRKLDSADAEERGAAVRALVALRSQRGAAAMLAALGRLELPMLREDLLDPDLPQEEESEPAAARQAFQGGLRELGAEATAVLRSGLSSSDRGEQIWAAYLLPWVGQDAANAGGTLLDLCASDDAELRLHAAAALGVVLRHDIALLERCANRAADGKRGIAEREACLIALGLCGQEIEKGLEAATADDGDAGDSGDPESSFAAINADALVPLVDASLVPAVGGDQLSLQTLGLRWLDRIAGVRDRPLSAAAARAVWKHLSADEEEIKIAALQLFHRTRSPPPGALAAFCAALGGSGDVATVASHQLVFLRATRSPDFLRTLTACLPELGAQELRMLSAAGTAGLPGLLKQLSRDHTGARARAAELLGEMGAAAGGAWEPLAATLADPHEEVSDAAQRALIRLAWTVKSDPEPLLRLLRNEISATRLLAAGVLGCGAWDEAAVGTALAGLCEDASPDVAAEALLGWSRVAGDKEALVARNVTMLASSPHAAVRRAAVHVLSERMDRPLLRDALPALHRAASDSNEEVRGAAAELEREILAAPDRRNP